jgi:hypothetical protein
MARTPPDEMPYTFDVLDLSLDRIRERVAAVAPAAPVVVVDGEIRG